MNELTCFKAYDVRGKLGEELNEDIAYAIGRAFAQGLDAKTIVVGGDVRLTSESLKKAVARGIMDAGSDVIDLGVTGTEEIYFASFFLDVDGGIEVTASHNPMDYNGIKFIGKNATPISGESQLGAIKQLAQSQEFSSPKAKGNIRNISLLDDYVEHILGYGELDFSTPFKLVVNSGNGASGRVIDAIETVINKNGTIVEFIKVHHEADGNFPNGIPNPLLVENRLSTTMAVKENDADMGIAWDGDFDRCFFFDEKGQYIEGYYIVGLLAQAFLEKNADKSISEKIIYDPRLVWNTIDIVESSGGIPIQSKSGHSFIKQAMRDENAIYGGEMSAHHYFRDFGYCDSGMIPWLLVLELIGKKKTSLSQLVGERIAAFPCSGEINYKVESVAEKIAKVRDFYQSGLAGEMPEIDDLDGVSISFSDWRMNLRSSNTEPLLRLNVEAKGDKSLVEKRVKEIESLIGV
ncbi:Phosphomannomutase [hydrothermal vent metagenome]|uniref:Phosphomannomutase n=1 Tax=hydrothermal vent metagenome TaxID=652676 RepID=A0A3B0U0D3_9ZZZZ